MTSERKRIISCGEVLWDLFPDGPKFGGAPANFACHAAILGGQVSMLSAVGDDARGSEAIEILRSFGLDTSLIQIIADAPTGSVSVDIDAAGKPTFTIHAGSAWDRIERSPALETRIADIDAIYFGTLGQRGERSKQTIRRALRHARNRGILRVLDVNLRKPFYDAAMIRESIALASVLKLSDDELPEVAAACGIVLEARPEATLRAMRGRCELEFVVMTRGPKGALLVSESDVVDQSGIPTVVVDTVGAGDAFTSALVLGLLRGDTRGNILKNACVTASAVCSHAGAVPRTSR
ncbi:MAG: carbohydrate kinase [Planctomycetota bacterium]